MFSFISNRGHHFELLYRSMNGNQKFLAIFIINVMYMTKTNWTKSLNYLKFKSSIMFMILINNVLKMR